MGLRDRQRGKIVASATRFLEPEEDIRFAVAGRSGLGSRIVVGTDAAVYLLAGSAWSVTKSTRVEARLPLAEATRTIALTQDSGSPVVVVGTQAIRLENYRGEDLEQLAAIAAGAGGDG
ncbi:MAG: hypothetical protein KY396_03655 [Actinobacteria bacterium]|nr:hypothetical protein [Actinomycetota bacterium]